MTKSKNTIKRLNSKEPLRTFSFGAPHASVGPDFSTYAVMELVNKDPVARGAVTHFVDKCVEGDFSIIKRDSKEFDSAFQDKLQKEFNFRTEVLRKIFLLGKLYQNVFVEIVRKSDSSVKALNVLDTANVDTKTKPNGDLIEVRSKVMNPQTGEYATWPASDICWIKFNDRAEAWAPNDFRSLWETLLAKDYVRQYVSWLWETGQYRVLYNFKQNASTQDIENFVAYGRKHDGNFKAPFLVKGDLETKILRDIKEQESIDILLKYYDNQIAIALRVPPIDLGIPESSGRSNADAQSNNFVTHIKSWKTIVEDMISNDLFKKMNHGNNQLRFAPTDRFVEKQVYEIVQMMKSMGMKDEVVKEYLFDRGIVFSQDALFDKPEEREMALSNPRDKDTAPSRQGKGAGEGNAKLDDVSTRPDQLSKQ